jgi:hypothetical protein
MRWPSAVQRLADYRPGLLAAGVYPLSFIWHTDYWTTVKNLLQDAFSRRRPEGILDAAKDFMLDRLDDALEPVARLCSGKAAWDEIKRNALAATRSAQGGAKLTARLVARLAQRHKIVVQLLAHSAGSIFHAPLVTELKRLRVPIESCTLWAPACTIELFKEHHLPLLNGKGRQALCTVHAVRQGRARRSLRQHLSQVAVVSGRECVGNQAAHTGSS